MRLLLILAMAVGVMFTVPGCREKTNEEKLKDAAKSVQKDAAAAKKDAKKKLDDLTE